MPQLWTIKKKIERKSTNSSNFIMSFLLVTKIPCLFSFYAVSPLLFLESAHCTFWSYARVQSCWPLPNLATPFASVLFISDTMQVNLTTSHDSVPHSAMCFYASKFCDIPRNEAIFKLKIIPSPEKTRGQESETQPPPRTAQCSVPSLQPHLPLPSAGKIRGTRVNNLRHTAKHTAKTYSLTRS